MDTALMKDLQRPPAKNLENDVLIGKEAYLSWT